MLVTFADNDRSKKADESGFNKIGYLTRSGLVIFPRRYRLVRENLSKIVKLPHALFQISEDFGTENVERFFTENFQTLDLFDLGLSAILNNDIAYFINPLKLPCLSPIDNITRGDRWLSLKALVIEGDLLCVFDTKSLFSRIISKVDRGPWSHSALCTMEKTIIEAITSGVCERPLDVYSASHYRVGLYRFRSNVSNKNKKDALEFMRSKIGQPYSYKKALFVGIQKFLHKPRFAPTPNDLAIHPDLDLITYV
jgi:hypothetical protein